MVFSVNLLIQEGYQILTDRDILYEIAEFLTIIDNTLLKNFSCDWNSFNRGYSCIEIYSNRDSLRSQANMARAFL